MTTNPNQRLAVLIDGDNISASNIGPIMAEIRRFGVIKVCRVYATTNNMRSWEKHIGTYHLELMTQAHYRKGKNATDIGLVIDAAKLLYKEATFDCFFLITSDSDFTPLAKAIQDENISVIGIGEKKTPETLRNACSSFRMIKDLSDTPQSNELLKLCYDAFKAAVQQNGWCKLSTFGSKLHEIDADFKKRIKKYGYKTLSQMVESMPQFFEVKQVQQKKHAAFRMLSRFE